MCVARPNQSIKRVKKKIITKQPFMTNCYEFPHGIVVYPSSEAEIISKVSPSQQLSEIWNKTSSTDYYSMVYRKKVHSWVLPLSISQSKYGGRKKPSSACTLITLQIAHDFLKLFFAIPFKKSAESQPLSTCVLGIMVNAIIDGNETHRKEMINRKKGLYNKLRRTFNNQNESTSFIETIKKPLRDTFTIPEAIKVHQPELHEIDYRSYLGNFIENLNAAITMGVNSSLLISLPRLAFGILAFERAMSCVYDRSTNSICLIDTHMHFRGRAGGIIISSSFDDVHQFIVTVTNLAFPEVFSTREQKGQFEISCLMLSSISQKVYKGHIFLPIRACPNAFKSYGKVKIQINDMDQTPDYENDNDSGYESGDDEKKKNNSLLISKTN